MNDTNTKTHFGFQTVDWKDKQSKVKDVFQSVAPSYDLMNDLMSFGVHRYWKQYTIALSRLRKGQIALDLAGGSGDITRLLSEKVGTEGQVYLADINEAMLKTGRDKLCNAGYYANIHYVQGNAETLPFVDDTFHCITMGFGLRNVTDKEKALRAMYRVLKPGGMLMILEFSKPVLPGLNQLYDWYSFNILPRLGHYFAQDADSYQYLAESIRMHPCQETLKQMIENAGFEDCVYHNLSAGIVALHIAYKY